MSSTRAPSRGPWLRAWLGAWLGAWLIGGWSAGAPGGGRTRSTYPALTAPTSSGTTKSRSRAANASTSGSIPSGGARSSAGLTAARVSSLGRSPAPRYTAAPAAPVASSSTRTSCSAAAVRFGHPASAATRAIHPRIRANARAACSTSARLARSAIASLTVEMALRISSPPTGIMMSPAPPSATALAAASSAWSDASA